MHCAWCHNPEGLSFIPELMYAEDRCISCGRCVIACPASCHTIEEGKHLFNRSRCIVDKKCVSVCPVNALKIAGKTMSIDEVLDVCRRDKPYYDASGGGVTLSGGEVTEQAEFALCILRRLNEESIHTCIETAGTNADALTILLPYINLVLLDFKIGEKDALYRYTGIKLDTYLAGVKVIEEYKVTVILRCPIIGGVNDSDQHMENIATFANTMSSIRRIELLPYHELGLSKSAQLSIEAQRFTTPTREELSCFAEYIHNKTGLDVSY
jgi:glycyl-radical enzyme activating protein